MNTFDSGVLLSLNAFAHRSVLFDRAVGYLSNADSLKGTPFMAAFWWIWFRPGPDRRRDRETVVATLAAACASIVLGRTLAAVLPFRVRPIFDPALGFVLPYGVDSAQMLRAWSAFPSDHAMLFAAMATGLYFVSRRLGIAAYGYWLLVVGLPRVYLGLHHPTDIIAGAVLGTAVAWVANTGRVRVLLTRGPLRWEERHPSSFYVAFFLFSNMVATMFAGPRGFLSAVVKLIKGRV